MGKTVGGGADQAKAFSMPQRNVVTNMGGKRLSDRTKKRIIADRIDGMSLRALAAKYNVSYYAVQKTVNSDPKLTQKISQKKEQNTLDMLAFLDEQKASAQEFVLMAMQALKDPEKLNRTGAQALATAMGIIIDKFTPVEKKAEDEGVTIIWGRQE